MTVAHRRWHFWLWLILGPLVAAGFVAGLLGRPAPAYEKAAGIERKMDEKNPLKEAAP